MKSPQPNPPESKTPLWETLVIIASFAGVWIYFMLWLSAGRARTPLPLYWQLLLVPCLVALFFVFRKRLARARNAVREANEQNAFPFSPTNFTSGKGKPNRKK